MVKMLPMKVPTTAPKQTASIIDWMFVIMSALP
jgi:hypothetical protein